MAPTREIEELKLKSAVSHSKHSNLFASSLIEAVQNAMEHCTVKG